MSSQSKFILSGTSVKDLTEAEKQAVKSLFYNRGQQAMGHTVESTATAKWVNVAGKFTIKVETDSTMY